MRIKVALTAVLLAGAVLSPAARAADPVADSPDLRLKQLEGALKKGEEEREQFRQKAEAIAKEVAGLKTEMITSARAVQEHEETLSELELQLSDLDQLEGEKTKALDLKRQQLNGVLTAVQRLAFRPSIALMAQPTSPADTVRSAILLRDVVPRIQSSATELKVEIDGLASLRADIDRQKQKIASTTAQLDGEHKRLAALYDRKQQIQAETESQRRDAEKRLQAMATEAEDMRDLIIRLEEERVRREHEAIERAAIEKAQREAERVAAKAAAKAAREAEIAAAKAARDAELAARQAEKERQQAQIEATRRAEQERKQAEEQARAAAREAQATAEKAARDAAEHDAAEKQAAQRQAAQKPFTRAQGDMAMPARGRVTVKFNQTNEVGSPSKGISIETRSNGQVIAPYDGQVVFSGPFRGYGLLLIIEHGEGYHTLLAGMARIDSTVGQHVLTGEPVGVMGQSEGKPLLYVELRHNGQPVNPLPWLTARKAKVSG